MKRIFSKVLGKLKTLNQVNGLRTIYYNMYLTGRFFGGILIGPSSIVRIKKKSKINIKGSLFVNKSWFANRKRVSKGVLIVDENGHLIVKGDFSMYDGSSIYVAKGATLELGDKSFINNCAKIDCYNHIIIGNNCYISDQVSIQDCDIHKVIENGKEKINSKPIIIEDKVWIGKNTLILKGVKLGSGSIIAAGSVVTKDVESKSMVAGNPARVVKRNITWE